MVSHTSGLVRDLDVLELLGTDEAFERGGYGVQDIAALTRRDKGQISRVCRTLAGSGLIARDPVSKKYQLGHRMFAIALRTREAHLATLSQPYLLELVAQSEESAHLTVLRGGGVLTLRTELSQHTLRDGSLSGVTLPALRTASGRAILATLSDQEIEAWWSEHGTFRTPPSEYPRQVEGAEIRRLRRQPGSIRSLSGLKRVVRGVRRSGYAVSVGELNPDIVDAAAAVVNGARQAVAAIAVGAIRERIGDRFEAMGEAVTRAARLLSDAIGSQASN
jgi:DNA-binding IclR family transcriptional regulator